MEAIVALSFACNVIQLVESGVKCADIILQTYKKGEVRHNLELREATEQLARLTEQIKSSLHAQRIANQVLSPPELELQRIAFDCEAKAVSLHAELQRLQRPRGGLTSLKNAIRAVSKQREISKLRTEYREYESRLNTGLLMDLRYQTKALEAMQQRNFGSLDTSLRTLIQNMASGHTNISDLLRSDGLETRQLVIQQHHETQLRIEQTHQALVSDIQIDHILRSLEFPSMNARINAISDADLKTFEWIFDEHTNISHVGDFLEWLRSGTDMFWIEGKAGSGKSTFMKFLWQHSKTESLAMANSSERLTPLILKHSFWLPGDELQRTLRGFLLTILHQLVNPSSHCTSARTALAQHARLNAKRSLNDWSERELSDLIKAILADEGQARSIVFFVDALDEFDRKLRDPMDLFRLLHQFSTIDNVKLCVASRPESLWLQVFSQTPKLHLHELTEADIKRYVSQQILDSDTVPQSSGGDDESRSWLIEAITNKAEGVFLWAVLAVSSALRGFVARAGWHEMRKRIEHLPLGITALYEDMWSRIAEDFPLIRQEAVLYLRYCYWSERRRPPTNLIEFAMISLHWTGIYTDLSPPNLKTVTQECERLLVRIPAVCAGMLHIGHLVHRAHYSWNYADLCLIDYDRNVEFMHRSVYDFLIDVPAGRALLQATASNSTAILYGKVHSMYLLDTIEMDGISYPDLNECWEFLSQCRHNHAMGIKDDQIMSVLVAVQSSLQQTPPTDHRRTEYLDVQTSREYDNRRLEYVLLRSHKARVFDPFASDLIGLSICHNFPSFLWNTLSHSRDCDRSMAVNGLTADYKDYLLACAAHGLDLKQNSSVNATSDLVNELLSASADPRSSMYVQTTNYGSALRSKTSALALLMEQIMHGRGWSLYDALMRSISRAPPKPCSGLLAYKPEPARNSWSFRFCLDMFHTGSLFLEVDLVRTIFDLGREVDIKPDNASYTGTPSQSQSRAEWNIEYTKFNAQIRIFRPKVVVIVLENLSPESICGPQLSESDKNDADALIECMFGSFEALNQIYSFFFSEETDAMVPSPQISARLVEAWQEGHTYIFSLEMLREMKAAGSPEAWGLRSVKLLPYLKEIGYVVDSDDPRIPQGPIPMFKDDVEETQSQRKQSENGEYTSY